MCRFNDNLHQVLSGTAYQFEPSTTRDAITIFQRVNVQLAQGTTPAHKSVAEVRKIVKSVPPPPGVKAYVAGNTVLNTDTLLAANHSMNLMTAVTIGVIFVMLLFIYRSLKNAILALILVRFELYAAEGIVATVKSSGAPTKSSRPLRSRRAASSRSRSGFSSRWRRSTNASASGDSTSTSVEVTRIAPLRSSP